MKASWEELILIIESAGWTIEEIEDERSRQYYEHLDTLPKYSSSSNIIYDEGPEPEDRDE